jgi:hypothetical protein
MERKELPLQRHIIDLNAQRSKHERYLSNELQREMRNWSNFMEDLQETDPDLDFDNYITGKGLELAQP